MDIMENVSEKNNFLKLPRVGDIVEGRIINKGKSAIFLDLGNFKTGIIYGKEYQEVKGNLKNLKIGDGLFVKIIDLENEEGYVELSVGQAGKELAWENLKQKKEKEEILKVRIQKVNKGGLLTEISGIPAFLPVSQLSPEHYPRVEGGDFLKILRELQKFIGKELEVKIFDLSQKEEKLILSEKAKETKKIKEMLENYKVGDIVEGEITAVLDFGAFMKFQKEACPKPIEGLIHISELDWQLIEDPSEVVKVGEKVKAKIIDISDDKVSLSLKALKKDPWKGIEKKYKKGDIVRGKITKFNPFGAFVQITPYSETKSLTGRLAKGEDRPKIQGLVHISEIGTKSKMAEKFKIGEEYDFQILSINPAEHRMSLKLAENKTDK